MDVPAIVLYGKQFIQAYAPQKFRDSLIRAFKKRRADFIVLDSNPRQQRFLAACVAWAIDAELLYNDRNANDGQQIVSSFRLTEKGVSEILGQ